MKARPLALALLLLGGGCGSSYVYGRLATVTPPARDPGCVFALLDSVPGRAFDELGVIAPRDIEYGATASSPASFTDKVRGWVCGSGGDAVVVERDVYGNYKRATVIKYR
jgi:hypothetical protein